MRILHYAVRISVLLTYFGQLCMVLACLTLVPLVASIYFGDLQTSWRYAVIVAVMLVFGMALARLKASRRVQTNEAMVITASIFIFAPLVLAWPVTTIGVTFWDAVFETISGATTTGLSAIDSLAGRPQTFLFSRAWMQWVGGLGITVLSVAALIQPGMAAKRFDLDDFDDNDLAGSTRTHARRILMVYTVLTLAGILALITTGTNWFDSILYAFAAISTGGFAPHDGSIGDLATPYAPAIVTTISMAGGISLLLFWRARNNGWRTFFADRQLQALLAVALASAAAAAFFLWYQDGLVWTNAVKHGVFNALSAQSTAGFSSMDLASAGSGVKASLILTMAVGGSMGSTAGGVKIIRLLILLRLLSVIVKRAGSPPNAVTEPMIEGRRMDQGDIEGVLCVLGAFIGLILLSWLPFVALGHAPLDALFEIVSAVTTSGLSAGITATDLHPLLKGILCVNMLMGRLEILVWLVVFYPGTWLGQRKES